MIASALLLAAVRLVFPVRECLRWTREVQGPTGPGQFPPIVDVCTAPITNYTTTAIHILALMLVAVALVVFTPRP